jgi:glycosyltransferase involved in cell wall biosynthesis
MAATRPQVSVCIAVYNCERYIGQAIESVLSQTFGDFELVVADNASTDGTIDVVRSYADPRIRLIRNEQNLGAVANFDLVMRAGIGNYIKLLGADDLLYPTCLERQVAVMEADPRLSLTACRRDIIDARDRVIIRRHGWWGRCGRYEGVAAIRRIVRAGRNLLGEPITILFRQSLLGTLGGFDPVMSDLDYWCRLLQLGDLYVDADALAAFRVSESSRSVHENWQHPRNQRRYFRQLRAKHIGSITRLDVAIGAVRSVRDMYLRHLVYTYLKLRGGLNNVAMRSVVGGHPTIANPPPGSQRHHGTSGEKNSAMYQR